jgi:hypothetical protein
MLAIRSGAGDIGHILNLLPREQCRREPVTTAPTATKCLAAFLKLHD